MEGSREESKSGQSPQENSSIPEEQGMLMRPEDLPYLMWVKSRTEEWQIYATAATAEEIRQDLLEWFDEEILKHGTAPDESSYLLTMQIAAMLRRIKMKYGIDLSHITTPVRGTYSALSKEMGISRERVRQMFDVLVGSEASEVGEDE